MSRAIVCELVRPIGRRQIGRHRIGTAACLADLGNDPVGFFGTAAVMHQNLRAGCGQCDRAGAAHAARSAGDERSLA